MRSELRTFIKQLSLAHFVQECHKRTGINSDILQDATLEVITAMLAQESRFESSFVNQYAFQGYVRTAAIRRALQAHRNTQQTEEIIDSHLTSEEAQTAEEHIIAALELQEYTDLVTHVLQKAKADKGLLQDGHQLIELVLSDPDRFLQRRKSGKNKGKWVFHYVELIAELGWNKQRVYERLERIRKLLLQARNQQDETQSS